MTDPIRERHVCDGDEPSWGCEWCNVAWPCDAIHALDELDKESMERADAERERDAARADADRLAEALYTAAVAHHVNGEQSEHRWRAFDECRSDYCIDARAALRAHDEATGKEG